MNLRTTIACATMLAVVIVSRSPSRAGDWPQILGPDRNGKAHGEQLLGQWPDGRPEVVWRKEVGSGFSGLAVSGSTAVLFHRVGDREIVEGMQAGSGEVLWKTGFPTSYTSGIAPDDGPRCVPTIHKDMVFVLGAAGRLACLGLSDGKTRWQRHLADDFDRPPSYFGAGSSPVVAGDRLLVNVGGQPEAGIVAFDCVSGETRWKSTDERASYASPIVAHVGGRRQAIFLTRLNVVSLDPATGDVLFRFPFGKRGPTVNGANPLLVDDNLLFVSASYGVGAKVVRITGSGTQELWESNDVMTSQYTTCVEHEGVLYGIHGRQDVGVAMLRAIDPKTGRVLWSAEDFGYATLIESSGRLLIIKTDGELVLAQANPQAYQELARAQVLDSTSRPLPALASGLLYVRDTRQLKCLRVGR